MRRHEQRARLLDERELQQAAGRAPHAPSLNFRRSEGGGSGREDHANHFRGFYTHTKTQFKAFGFAVERSVALEKPTLAT